MLKMTAQEIIESRDHMPSCECNVCIECRKCICDAFQYTKEELENSFLIPYYRKINPGIGRIDSDKFNEWKELNCEN